jgi:iron complex transport system substrate-binding protein
MMLRLLLLLVLGLAPLLAQAGEIADATGRVVQVPDQVRKVLPAGVPAQVLVEALAPDLMAGWPHMPGAEARALLAPEAAALPAVPMLASHDDVTDAVRALAPDLIVDYGDVTPAYSDLAKKTQERTGIAMVLLDGSLAEIPHTLRVLGAALHREQRAETLARLAEAMLALPSDGKHPRVVYARGPDGLTVVAPDNGSSEVFARLGWQVLAPPGKGRFRKATLADIAALDPDIIVFGDAHMRATVSGSADWRALRAVREGHAVIAPALPFGWVEEPPSLNRLLGLAWLGGHDAATLAAVFGAVVYGHAPSAAELQAVADGVRPLQP